MSDLISKEKLIKHLEAESGMNIPEWLRENIENAPTEKVYVVTSQDGREAPCVALYANEKAAERRFKEYAELCDRAWFGVCVVEEGEA